MVRASECRATKGGDYRKDGDWSGAKGTFQEKKIPQKITQSKKVRMRESILLSSVRDVEKIRTREWGISLKKKKKKGYKRVSLSVFVQDKRGTKEEKDRGRLSKKKEKSTSRPGGRSTSA